MSVKGMGEIEIVGRCKSNSIQVNSLSKCIQNFEILRRTSERGEDLNE